MANAPVVLAGLVFLLASVGSRLHVLLDWPVLRPSLDALFHAAAGGSALLLLLRRPRWVLVLTATGAVLATYAYASLYWPSLRPGIPTQDFLLADAVSANYSWDQAMTYLRTVIVMVAIGLAARVSWADADSWSRRLFYGQVAMALAVNFAVIGVQGSWDIAWLGAGSGTAVSHFRAAGLLEDSGASTVYASAVLGGALFVLLFVQHSRLVRGLLTVAVAGGVVVGAATTGRTFFVSLVATAVTGVLMWLLRPERSARARWGGVWGVVAGAFAGVVALGQRSSVAAMDLERFVDAPLRSLETALLTFDPVRTIHLKVMWAAFRDHPWSGSGFGMFYANLYEYREWAMAAGGQFFPDPAGSMYALLLSEFGLAGALLIVVGLSVVRMVARGGTRSVQGAPVAGSAGAGAAWAAGVAISLAVSFLVGLHVIFWSVPALLIPAAAWARIPLSARGGRWMAMTWLAALVLVAGACVHLWATAPRAPEFRWKERGTPQIPVSLVVPIWPAGLEGIWASSGAEFLFDGKPLWFHIERPAEFYPMTFTIQVFDRGGRQVVTHEQVFEAPTGADPGRLIQVPFDDDVNSLCSTNITPDDHCSFRITTTPEWTLDTQPVAVLYVTRNLR